MKVGCIMWGSHIPTLVEASKQLDFVDFKMKSMRDLEDEQVRADFLDYLEQEAEIILLYPTSNEIWDEIVPRIEQLKKQKPVICFGHDPTFFSYSSVKPEYVAEVHRYINIDGLANMENMLCYIGKNIAGLDIEVKPPADTPWAGIYHPEAPDMFTTTADYLDWCQTRGFTADMPTVGILFYRSYWVNGNVAVPNALIKKLEQEGVRVIPLFSRGFADRELGVPGNDVQIRKFFMDNGKAIIDLMVDLQSFFLVPLPEGSDMGSADAGVKVLQELDIPVLNGLVSSSQTEEEWRADGHGLRSYSWSVAMPEFDGITEPLMLGCQHREADTSTGVTLESYHPVAERIDHVVKRIQGWLRLKRTPLAERKVVFVFHNNPCASVEGTVGSGANLDTIESVARLIQQLQEKGYYVENTPASGAELIDTIMSRKAISEFRWTTIEEIVEKGGVLANVTKEQYLKWFHQFPENVQQRIIKTWEEPIGIAMVYEDKIVVTGVQYGNIVVCVQPKRGCYGSRCDGEVCKILHEPDCPPTHQYIATYRYLEDVFGANVIIHVGTHGNLEFLPGKAVGLSDECYPDLTLGAIPHLYIYSVDNPPEGTIAKRRSYATLVDYMVPVLKDGGLGDNLRELEDFLGEYGVAKATDPARAHSLQHLILEKIEECSLTKELKISPETLHHKETDFDHLVKKCHGILTRLRESQFNKGLHIFGSPPVEEDKVDLIASMIKFDFEGECSLRRIILELMGLDYDYAAENPGEFNDEFKKTYGELLQDTQAMAKKFIQNFLSTGIG